MVNSVLKHFQYYHLTGNLKEVSKKCHDLAKELNEMLPDSEQKGIGFGKLLEAKDCFVRAAFDD